ncbi:arginyltransferase [Marinobacterium sp. AK62]|uniref:Aspartate/glutamate leucyltransferase n=1 Tax=Marinobacterium alkalitolerans TaxID=1542925 RepID=A0ABS3ZBT3_9GAMM|nr:arginyltransferase [Marinobacterium alkalitolerans]MBP0049167.1 arginyltransferase [Marinobacterium alkalitolerans]
MSSLRTLKFYATPVHDCSYLPDMQARTLFVDPRANVSKHLYSQLSDLGFRRSGSHIYRPHCEHCQACISVRIPVDAFKPSKTQKRIENRNRDLLVRSVPCQLTAEYYALYERYICQRHKDGDMYPPTPEQFVNFLIEGSQDSCFYEFRAPDGQLVAISVCDRLEQGLSALYTFFDPDLDRRSLGVNAVLWLIREAQHANLPYLYLGYWVRNCRKMNYKTAYRPLEMLLDGEWQRMHSAPGHD